MFSCILCLTEMKGVLAIVNETYEWLYDRYALPLMRVKRQADRLKREIVSCKRDDVGVALQDKLDDLCQVWGTESFALGLQLGLRLMAGQSPDGLLL